ncbi:MAG: ribonuclease P protein component [Candidatus Kerfeldbacteria bacterium]|jgi:ribonuclease P protein component
MLPKERRIVKLSEWNKLHKRGIGAHSAEIVLKYIKNNTKITRFGFIVSTKISKKAVDRNLIKRRMRDVIEKKLSNIKEGYDVILIAKVKIKSNNYSEIEQMINQLLRKERLLTR